MPVDQEAAARTLFGDTLNEGNKLTGDDTDLGLTPEQTQQADELWRGGLNAMEFSDPEGEQITKIVKQAINDPASESQQAEWKKTTEEGLRREFGDGGADKKGSARHRLALAKQLLAKHPAHRKFIEDNGLGSHPALTKLLLEKSWSLRASGRL